MSKKGKHAEIFSKARHIDNPNSYIIEYLDYDNVKQVTLQEFIKKSNNFEIIPITRIYYIKKGNKILFSKTKQILR